MPCNSSVGTLYDISLNTLTIVAGVITGVVAGVAVSELVHEEA